MAKRFGGLVLFAGLVLLSGSSGCGDDHHNPDPCRGQCSPGKPYCAPDGKCVECVYNSDCPPGDFCNKNYECKH
jgi:Cys-rich repeat protein